MNKNTYFTALLLGIMAVSLCSCKSYQNFTVQAPPGTVISDPNNQRLAVVDNSGTANLKIERRNGLNAKGFGYLHFLQAQVPGSNLQVPFALDYKDHSRSGKRALGSALVVPGVILELSGVLGLLLTANLNDDYTTILLSTMTGIGVGASLLGLPWIALTPIDSDYDYSKQQTINNDLFPK